MYELGIAEIIKIGSDWGFETPNFAIRFGLLLNSQEFYNWKKHAWLIHYGTMIARNERFSDNLEKAERTQEHWEHLREMFFGDKVPKYWNEMGI